MPAGMSIPTDAGAGFNLKTPEWLPQNLSLENGIPKGIPEQMQRALAVAAYFFSGVVAINTSQMLAAPMSVVNNEWYEGWLSLTKQSFGLLTTTMTQFWAPTVMRVSGDKSVRGQLTKTDDGDLIYWLYLWWVAYTAGKHGNVYIILKESLKKIPVIGWGMRLNKFIFLKRNWEKDKPHLSAHMQRLNKLAEPMWLMLFPEGTNLAPDTRIKSRKWAAKNHLKDMQHTLLPRSTGLRFCLQELKGSVGWMYDCTMAYSGVPRGKYAQDIYTLRASYLEGRPPKSVNMYWRRFRLSEVPLDSPLAFESWLLARWREKDSLIEYFYKYGKFPADTGVSLGPRGEFLRGAGHIESEVRANKWRDFLQVFAPMGMLALVLFMFYGALPKGMMDAIGGQAGEISKQVEGANDGNKLLAFDGKEFKQVSAGTKELADVVREGLRRPPARRADSVSGMSTGPRGPLAGSHSQVGSSRGPQSVAQSEPKRMLGFSEGKFREVSPARSVASTRTAATRSTASASVSGKTNANSTQHDDSKSTTKLLGFAGNGYRKVAPVAKSATQSKPSKQTVASTQSSQSPGKSLKASQPEKVQQLPKLSQAKGSPRLARRNTSGQQSEGTNSKAIGGRTATVNTSRPAPPVIASVPVGRKTAQPVRKTPSVGKIASTATSKQSNPSTAKPSPVANGTSKADTKSSSGVRTASGKA